MQDMIKPQYSGVIDCFRKIIAKEGVCNDDDVGDSSRVICRDAQRACILDCVCISHHVIVSYTLCRCSFSNDRSCNN